MTVVNFKDNTQCVEFTMHLTKPNILILVLVHYNLFADLCTNVCSNPVKTQASSKKVFE